MSVPPKLRTPVPAEIAAAVMYAHDRTCCVCRQPGLTVQIHHVDDDPTNHDPDNLAVLCLEDHNRTQVRGGFGRRLSAAEVRIFRDKWLEHVRQRRARAEELAAQAMARVSVTPPAQPHGSFLMPPAAFIASLPAIRKEALIRAQQHWPSWATADVMNRQYEYIEALRGILTALAAFYPSNHFNNQPAQEYFVEVINSRFLWHRARLEPEGPGSGGTMIGPMVVASVAADVEGMIVDLVLSLSRQPEYQEGLSAWKTAWDEAGKEGQHYEDPK